MKTKKKKSHYRIQWEHIQNVDCAHLISHGLHARTIALATGLTEGQVNYRAMRLGIRLRDYRNGTGPVGGVILKKFTVQGMAPKVKNPLLKAWKPIIKRRLEENVRQTSNKKLP